MYKLLGVSSLIFFSFGSNVVGQGDSVDVNNPGALKTAAKSFASGISVAYNESLKNSGAPGLFGDDVYFIDAGNVWNALLEYSYLTGDAQYDNAIFQALQWQQGDNQAFLPANQTATLGNDDQSSWGLAAMTAAEINFKKPSNGEWVDYATRVWSEQTARLDAEVQNKTCGGGLRWQLLTFNKGYTYKNAATNGQYFLLSARLAKYTGNSTFTTYATQIYKWSKDVGLVDQTYRVFDGTSAVGNCSTISRFEWTANKGVYLEGAALMLNVSNGASNWTTEFNGLLNSTSEFQDSKSGVLFEAACENNGKCDNEQRAFKGTFVQSLARAALVVPASASNINSMLKTYAKAAVGACQGQSTDPSCKMSWANPDSKWESETASDGGLAEVYAALQAVQGPLYAQAKPLKSLQSSGSNAGNSGTSGNNPSGSTNSTRPNTASGVMAPSPIVCLLFLSGIFLM